MPLNVPKNYQYVPSRQPPARIVTRSARRARLLAGGTYFRAVRRGQDGNLIFISIQETPGSLNKQGALIVHDRRFDPAAQITQNLGAELFSASLLWNQRIVLTSLGETFGAVEQGISWQIGASVTNTQLGNVPIGRVFTHPLFTVRLQPQPLGTVIVISPIIKIYQLNEITVDPPDTGGGGAGSSVTGWDLGAVRVLVNSDTSPIVTMPPRAGTTPGQEPPGSDSQDDGEDALVGAAFDFEPMTGGDGLPISPAGLDTGPDRTLIHLNYSELDDGRMGVLNHIYEWSGVNASVGSWQRYS